ncbi:response regulator [Delftia sp. UGAL515B_04]|uniref:response regulator n=1 Tax=Delftia sp. UGAL515B_04 TaxID=2986766 RepID=UPI00398602A7
MRILVVDDDSDIAETMAALLEMDGAEASPCTSAREALKKLAQGSWNVVLLDIGMPEMDGVEVAQVIRDSSLGARLFIVAITGHSQAQMRSRIAETEFDLIFTKPADPEHLCRALGAWWNAPAKVST